MRKARVKRLSEPPQAKSAPSLRAGVPALSVADVALSAQHELQVRDEYDNNSDGDEVRPAEGASRSQL